MTEIRAAENIPMMSQVKPRVEVLILSNDDAASEVREVQQSVRRTPSESQTKSKEERKQPTTAYHVLKLIISSLLVGTFIFFLLHYRHNIQDWVAGISGGSVAIGISILLAFSQSARCIISLLIPSLGTRLGKSSLVALLASMLLAGPAANLNYNFKQMTQSLICFGEAAFNQTRFASEHYKESMREMSRQVGDSLANYVNLVGAIQQSIDSIDNLLKETSNSFDSTLNDFDVQMNRCRETMTSVNGDCQKKMDSLKEECISVIKGRGLFRRKKRNWLSVISDEVKKFGSEISDHVNKIKLTDVCDFFSSDLCKLSAEICGAIKKVIWKTKDTSLSVTNRLLIANFVN